MSSVECFGAMIIQHTRIKYRLFKVSELDLVQPKPTMIIQIREAMVST